MSIKGDSSYVLYFKSFFDEWLPVQVDYYNFTDERHKSFDDIQDALEEKERLEYKYNSEIGIFEINLVA